MHLELLSLRFFGNLNEDTSGQMPHGSLIPGNVA